MFKNYIKKLKDHKVAQDTGWLFVGNIAKTFMQTLTFLLLAKLLGLNGFGAFTASLAIASIIAPFVHLGAYFLIINEILKKESIEKVIGKYLSNSLIVLPIGILIVSLISYLVTLPLIISLNISAGLFIGSMFIGINKAINITQGSLKYTAYLEFALSLFHFIFVLFLLFLNGSLFMWSIFYLSANIIISIFIFLMILIKFGMPIFSIKEFKRTFREGVPYAISGVANNSLIDIDKTMLVKFASIEASGIISLAQKVVNIAFLPLMSFLGAIYPKFVNQEESSYSKSRKIAMKVLPIILAYCVTGYSIIWIFAPFITQLMGDEYSEAILAVRILGLLIIIQGIQYPFADALTGSGRQKLRTNIQLFMLGTSILLNILLIPKFGWIGAAVASIVTQFFFLIILLCIPLRSTNNKRKLSETRSS